MSRCNLTWLSRGGARLLGPSFLLVLVAGVAAEPAKRTGREFSPSEQALLKRGELVTRPKTVERDGSKLIGGGTWVVIDAAPEVVWRALNDQPRWPRMFPNLREVRALRQGGLVEEFYVKQGIWPVFVDLHLLVEPDARERQLRFRINQARDNGLEAFWGFYRIAPFGKARTILAFGVMADLGGGITSLVASSMIHREMLKSPITIKHFLERGGRDIYAPRTP